MSAREGVVEGTLVHCGSACGLRCALCPSRGGRAMAPAAAVRRAIAAEAAGGARRVVFVGGDPLLREDLSELAAFARSKGLAVGVATHARGLAQPALRAALRACGVDAVVMGLFSSDPRAHGDWTRTPGALVETLAALRRLLERPGTSVEVRIPVLRGVPLPDPGLFLRLAGRAGAGLYFTFFYPSPEAPERGMKDLLLPPDEAASALSRCLRAFHRAGLRAFYEGLPPCLMGEAASSELEARRFRPAAAGLRTCLGANLPEERVQTLFCSECSLERSCPGVPRAAVELFGFDAVRPFKEVRSNSFDYTFARELRGFRPARRACRGDGLLGDCPPLRGVYLERGGKVSLYHADTRSFGDADLRAVKFSREQLYLDITDKPMLNDCQNDVRQLALREVCRACAKRERCAACYEVREELPFEREERWLREEIRRTAGRVLDIGCGDLRFYRETVETLLAQGRIEYHGLDVDVRALSEIRRRHPKARVHEAPIEDFSFRPGYFDYVFALRSLNHFQDLEKAFAAMLSLVRDRGIVVIAECVPFGLLRSERQTRRARRASGPGFEHYRNWSSEQTLEFIRRKGYPLKLNTHRPVRPGTSNQWLLKLIKAEGA